MNQARTLPDFQRPPVVETVIGVEFVPLDKWRIPFFGLYWSEIKSRFPKFDVQQPVAPNLFRISPPVQDQQFPQLQLSADASVRCRFYDQTETRLIQVQQDRFMHNWRKVSGDEQYPHYDNIRPTFEAEYTRFLNFLRLNDLGEPQISSCEVTYVNHIEKGSAWKSTEDMARMIAPWSGKFSGTYLPAPELVNLDVRFRISETGDLRITTVPAVRHSDAKEIVQMTLTARGRPKTSNLTDIMIWLDAGREWIVKGFTDFTTQDVHKVWGRTL